MNFRGYAKKPQNPWKLIHEKIKLKKTNLLKVCIFDKDFLLFRLFFFKLTSIFLWPFTISYGLQLTLDFHVYASSSSSLLEVNCERL